MIRVIVKKDGYIINIINVVSIDKMPKEDEFTYELYDPEIHVLPWESKEEPEVPIPTVFTVAEFLYGLFTKEERKLYFDGIRGGNTELETFKLILGSAVNGISIKDTTTQAGLRLLVQEGVLTPNRANEIAQEEISTNV